MDFVILHRASYDQYIEQYCERCLPNGKFQRCEIDCIETLFRWNTVPEVLYNDLPVKSVDDVKVIHWNNMFA